MPRSCCRRSPVTIRATRLRPPGRPDYRAGLASSDLKGARLGIPRSMFERDCPASGPMRGAFDAAVEVLRISHAYERTTPCRERRPPL
jgi:hypothetical protein